MTAKSRSTSALLDRKSTRLNSSHSQISYAVFCLKKKKMTLNRYLVGQGSERMLVLYWYQAHGRVTPSEHWAKIFLVTDSMRLNRTDGALVRILTSYESEEGSRKAEDRAVEFTKNILLTLDTHIPH